MYAEIVAAIQSTKTTIDLLKAANGLSNHTEVVIAVNAVQMKLTDAIASALESQEKQAKLAERVRELESKLDEVESWNTQMQRYALFEFPTKALAYALRSGMERGEPMHYLCAACADKKRRSTLQPIGHYLHCPTCKTQIAVADHPPRPQRRSSGPSWRTA